MRDPIESAVGAALAAIGPGLYGVACSGGADSMTLAHAAIAVAGAAHVVVLVIDHGLHADSARIADEVVAWARARGAAGVVRRVEVARRASLEAAAREARYGALDALADELGLAAILVGHTARDQAETVMMRIVRGTGPAGLAGIPARRGRIVPSGAGGAMIVRPLLAIERAAIDAYVAAHAIPTWHDPMNDDRALARVRMRSELLPALRRENPQLDRALRRLADSAAEWSAVIDARATRYALPIDCTVLAGEPAAIRKRAVALALEAAGVDVEAVHLEAIDALVIAPSRGERRLAIPGATLVRSYATLDLVAAVVEPPALRAPPGPYELRVWRAGDRMRPARLKGRSRKLSDLYGDMKLPRAQRATARVIERTTDHVIVWAEHVGIAFDTEDFLAPGVVDLPT
ncbi:MAG TPA: tRNA lysidine(34) synthetase TilS [Kofleriaceae bacterium]|nr:tRNA lysidine(34) synthetase TilS [Kofleriaceae bacterium]